MQERVGNTIFYDDFAGFCGCVHFCVSGLFANLFLAFLPLVPGVNLVGELALGKLIAPNLERALGELHNVALVDESNRRFLVVDGVLNGGTNKALCALLAHRLDADARRFGEADFLHAHFLNQELLDFQVLGGAVHIFDTSVDVFGVLAEDAHINKLGAFYRRRCALIILHGAQAYVKVESLTQSHVERADTAANRGCERAFDAHQILAESVESLVGKPAASGIEGFFASQNLFPLNFAFAAVVFGHSRVHYFLRCRPDVAANSVALDERDYGVVRHIKFAVADCDFFCHNIQFILIVYEFDSMRRPT